MSETPIEADPSAIEAEYGSSLDMDFAAFDPTEIRIPEDTPQGGAEDTDPEPMGPFDERYREPFAGLMFLGALQASFDFIGHRFVIRTLTTDETLAIGMITKEFEETIGAQRAYATALVALCIQSVDGRQLPSPIGTDDNNYAWAFERFNYVKARWFPYVVDNIYERYLLLESKTIEVLQEMAKKVSGQTQSTLG